MILILKAILNLIYTFMKLLPTKNKITFLSRQSNKPSQDALMLAQELSERDENLQIAMLFKTMDNKPAYCFHMLVQMYHTATSRVVVLDSYAVIISVLKHKKSLKVVQMWHALGALKRFGYSILNEEEGSSSKLAEAMNMHRGYDVVFSSSSYCCEHFAEAFGCTADKLTVMSLPRVDLLKSREYQETKRSEIHSVYPQLAGKETIVYAPTFRKSANIMSDVKAAETLTESIDTDRYNLVIKAHPLAGLDIKGKGILTDIKFTTMDMLAAADYIVLDYSAVVYEAALLGKPLFFYAFDLDAYKNSRNFYIDYEREMPGKICRRASDIARAVSNREYDLEAVKKFADRYVEKQSGCTAEMADFILKMQ